MQYVLPSYENLPPTSRAKALARTKITDLYRFIVSFSHLYDIIKITTTPIENDLLKSLSCRKQGSATLQSRKYFHANRMIKTPCRLGVDDTPPSNPAMDKYVNLI